MTDDAAPTFASGETSAFGVAAPRTEETPGLPPRIGRYRILRLLGEGGMGAVYEAEQDSPKRTVALKVIRAGYTTGEMLRRFENETQALGRLQHPGIAQIYEAGTAETPFGRQPYFAMELVRGETLIDYCDQRRLNAPQRLELMAKICDAVQHAHQRGLIHRDLKPANILVDDSGQPRILDFGVARLTDSDTQATRQTDMGQLIGTLAYMSPKQVLGDPQEIDTRSDVYALGVITHKHERVQRWLTKHKRFHVRFTPTSASWLNMVERFFRDLTQNRLRRGVFQDLEQLIMAIGEYIDSHNENPKPFIWTAKASDILEKVTRAKNALNKRRSA